MHPIRTALLAAVPAFAAALAPIALSAPADGSGTAPRYFDLVNASHDSVVSFAVAPAARDAFQEVAFDAPLRGGRTSTTVGLPNGGCLRDFRITFGDGRVLLYTDIDTCRYQRLQLTHRDGRDSRPGPDRPVAAAP